MQTQYIPPEYPSTTMIKHANVLAKVNKIALWEFTQYDATRHLQYYNTGMYNEPRGHQSWTKGVKSQ